MTAGICPACCRYGLLHLALDNDERALGKEQQEAAGGAADAAALEPLMAKMRLSKTQQQQHPDRLSAFGQALQQFQQEQQKQQKQQQQGEPPVVLRPHVRGLLQLLADLHVDLSQLEKQHAANVLLTGRPEQVLTLLKHHLQLEKTRPIAAHSRLKAEETLLDRLAGLQYARRLEEPAGDAALQPSVTAADKEARLQAALQQPDLTAGAAAALLLGGIKRGGGAANKVLRSLGRLLEALEQVHLQQQAADRVLALSAARQS
jgi:hypothetical protein